MQHAGLVHPVVLAPLKEGVEEVGQVGHGALSLGCAQQHVVPLPQPVAPGRLLTVRVAVQDVVITLQAHQVMCMGWAESGTCWCGMQVSRGKSSKDTAAKPQLSRHILVWDTGDLGQKELVHSCQSRVQMYSQLQGCKACLEDTVDILQNKLVVR